MEPGPASKPADPADQSATLGRGTASPFPYTATHATDPERCPRCGTPSEEVQWGHTDCPNCGLHFECC